MTVSILDLPPEIILLILKLLNPDEAITFCKACKKWFPILTDFILFPYLEILANVDPNLKALFSSSKGWAIDYWDYDTITEIWEKYQPFKCKCCNLKITILKDFFRDKCFIFQQKFSFRRVHREEMSKILKSSTYTITLLDTN